MLEDFLNNLMIKKIQEYGKKENFKKVLDIGGKNGKYTSKISEELTVLDLNPQKISSNIKYIKADILKFDTAEKYDLIVCSAVLEHFKQEDGLKVVKKINYYLEKDGLTFITCPNARSLNRMLGEILGMGKVLELSRADIRVGHKYLYDLPRLENVIRNILRYVDSGSYFLKPLPTSEMNKLFDNNALKAFASINSNAYPQLKLYLAEIYVVGKKLEK